MNAQEENTYDVLKSCVAHLIASILRRDFLPNDSHFKRKTSSFDKRFQTLFKLYSYLAIDISSTHLFPFSPPTRAARRPSSRTCNCPCPSLLPSPLLLPQALSPPASTPMAWTPLCSLSPSPLPTSSPRHLNSARSVRGLPLPSPRHPRTRESIWEAAMETPP